MASNFEQLVFEIIATDKNASAAFDRFRQKVDSTSRSVDENSGKLDKNAKSLDNVGKSAAGASPLLSGLAGSGGMGALIGAGVALSPVIATVGAGLAGFGLAAVGVAKPVLDAAQKVGGLKAHMDELDPEQRKLAVGVLGLQKQYQAFGKSLQPQVLGVFGKGLQLAGHLMHDVQPIAKATGNAIGSLLDRVDAEFASKQWQSFFSWMSANVGPDIKLIGQSVIDLVDALPALLQSLQPVAIQLLQFIDDAAKLLDWSGRVKLRVQQLGHTANTSGGFLGRLAGAAKQAFNEMVPGVKDSQKLEHWLAKLGGTTQTVSMAQAALNKRLADGHAATADLIHPLSSAAVGTGIFATSSDGAKIAAQHETTAVNILNTALKGLSSGLLTGEQDQISWKQAQQAATAAIKANTGSLNSNRSTALAARAAIIQSTQAAITFANQEVSLHHNTDAASRIIQQQINYLKQHAGSSRIAREQLAALEAVQAKLHSKSVTITERGIGHFSIFGRNTSSTPALAGGAQGLFINRGTSATADDVLIRASKGELVVPTKMVSAGLVDHLRGLIPGFATGGMAGLPGQTTAFDSRFQSQFTGAMKTAMSAAMRTAIAAAQSALSFHLTGGGALGGSAAANRAIAMRMFPWPMSMFPSFDYVEMREAGYSLIAQNPSSGAYGMAQFINGPGEYAQWGGNANTAGGQLIAMFNYIRSRYGNPEAAAAHERNFNWYDNPAGTWMPPGPSLAYNGTGAWEHLTPDSGRKGPLLVIEHLHVREAADVDLLARRLAFLDN